MRYYSRKLKLTSTQLSWLWTVCCFAVINIENRFKWVSVNAWWKRKLIMNTTVVEQLKVLSKELDTQFGIQGIALFGSYARSEEGPDSDIDIAIISMQRKNGLLIAKAQRYLSERLNANVDIGILDAMHPFIQDAIKQDMIYV